MSADKSLGGISLLDDISFKDKRVFLRVDFNCPLKDGVVTDDTRIKAALPTIKFLMEKGAKLLIGSHLGRPEGKKDMDFSMSPVSERLGELTGYNILQMDDPMSDAPKALLKQLKKDELIVLENLRFAKDEKERSGKLANHWASFIDVYINDAFGVCHRKDTSVYDLPLLIKNRGAGRLIEKEIKALGEVRNNPKRPFAVIMGGAKVSDKVPMIKEFMEQTDIFVIGGAMAFTFLKAKGFPVGNSLVENDLVSFCKDLMRSLDVRDKKLLLPVDFIEAKSINSETGKLVQKISDEMSGFDIGPKSAKLFVEELKSARSVLWNGPMGVFENEAFSEGTKTLCKGLAGSSAEVIVGGGDTAAAANLFGGEFSHISTGGGASLAFLEGQELPGLKALRPLRKEVLEDTRETLDPVDPAEFEKDGGFDAKARAEDQKLKNKG